MALPDFSMRQLLEAGAHFGHQSHRWNPKMSPFIFGTRNNIHIIDLAQTVPLLHRALQAISDTVAAGGRVLFVGTKRQASESISEAAKRSAQYFVNSRWLGGMLTNWKTISGSIQRLRKVDEMLTGGAQGLTKKERLMLSRERDKLERALGGIKDMGGTPDFLFVIDTNKEQLAIKEAQRLGIPVAAIVDTNCNPDGITYPIPANDDAGPRHLALLRACRSSGDRWHLARPRRHGRGSRRRRKADRRGRTSGGRCNGRRRSTDRSVRDLSAPRGAPDDLTKLNGVVRSSKRSSTRPASSTSGDRGDAAGGFRRSSTAISSSTANRADGWITQARVHRSRLPEALPSAARGGDGQFSSGSPAPVRRARPMGASFQMLPGPMRG